MRSLFLLLAMLVGSTSLASPPVDGPVVPCVLDGFRWGSLTYDGDGTLWLLDGDEVLIEMESDIELAVGAHRISCVGNKVQLVSDGGGKTLHFETATLDLADVLATFAPERTDPGKRTMKVVRARMDAGDHAGALAAHDAEPAAAAELSGGMLRREVLDDVIADLDSLDPPAALAALEGVMALLGAQWDAVAGDDASSLQSRRGQWLCAVGRAEEGLAVLESALAHTTDPDGALAAADAAWTLGRKKESRSWYAVYLEGGGTGLERIGERCRSCAR